MTERVQPRWTAGDWRGHTNYRCRLCEFATLDHGAMMLHARDKHPLTSEGGDPAHGHPLYGINFETDRAADRATEAGLTAEDFQGITPTGANGGYVVADVRIAAARSTTEKE